MSDTNRTGELPIATEQVADDALPKSDVAHPIANAQHELIALLQNTEQEPMGDTRTQQAVEFRVASAEDAPIDSSLAVRDSGERSESVSTADQKFYEGLSPQNILSLLDQVDQEQIGDGAPKSGTSIQAIVEFGTASIEEILVDAGSVERDSFAGLSDRPASGDVGSVLPPEGEEAAHISVDPLAIKVLFGDDSGSS